MFSHAELAASMIRGFENILSDIEGGVYTYINHIVSTEESLTQDSHLGLVPVRMSLHALASKLNMHNFITVYCSCRVVLTI